MPPLRQTVFFDDASSALWAELPLTAPTGKVRVKRRSHFSEYGEPVAARFVPLSQADYVEWQIGYDIPAVPENAAATTLSGLAFTNAKGEAKHPFELSELLFHSARFGFVSGAEVAEARRFVAGLADADLVDARADMAILRSHPAEAEINGIPFFRMEVRYPLAVHRFGSYEICAEVMNREKQKGVGVQPMLYVCIPLSVLSFAEPPFGRTAEKGETCSWRFGPAEGELALELFRVFGMLSARHRHDTLAKIDALFPGPSRPPSVCSRK